jgi:pyruvate,water dikinase
MDNHGHRGVVELDLMRQSWKTEPLPFITLLQSIVASKSHFKDGWEKAAKVEYPTTEAVLDALETPIRNSTRKVLKFILPYCRSSVWNREKTKSLLVGVANQFKLAYNALGEQLVRDQLISNPKLVYFFTHYELSQIISRSHSSPRILYKAMRREKLHRSLDNEKYPEFSKGIPEPIDDSIPVELGDQIKATPVSSGKVQGVAKVCLSLDEAAELVKPGDILITHGTDIGWSPFFPMLGGVVTELGGLISHGAVVAREYGLPCIVGASHATKIFKTGDLVLLNANEGTLSKVKTEGETSGPPGTD